MKENPRFSLKPLVQSGTNRNDSPFWEPVTITNKHIKGCSTKVVFPGCPGSRTPDSLCLSMKGQLKRGNEEK